MFRNRWSSQEDWIVHNNKQTNKNKNPAKDIKILAAKKTIYQ